MIAKLVQAFSRLDREIVIISRVLYVFIFLLIVRVVSLIYSQNLEQIWSLIGALTSIFAAVLVTKVSSRLIINGQIVREDERRIDIVRITHHLIVITSDLRARVGYFKKTLTEGAHTPSVLKDLSLSIEKRYEALLVMEPYRYLPGESVSLIRDMSGSVFGLSAFSNNLALLVSEKPVTQIKSIVQTVPEQMISGLSKLEIELDKLISQIYVVRENVDQDRCNEKP